VQVKWELIFEGAGWMPSDLLGQQPLHHAGVTLFVLGTTLCYRFAIGGTSRPGPFS